MRGLLAGVLQLLGAACAVLGAYLLLGLAWALVLAGAVLLVVGVLVELPAQPERRPRRRVQEAPITEIPGAVRSRPRED
jgi:hypothetical protein